VTVLRLARIASDLGILSAETVPWSNFRTHPHWAKVCWIPFRDYRGAGSVVDFCQNIGLTLPFGWMTGTLGAWMGAAIGLQWKSNH